MIPWSPHLALVTNSKPPQTFNLFLRTKYAIHTFALVFSEQNSPLICPKKSTKHKPSQTLFTSLNLRWLIEVWQTCGSEKDQSYTVK